MASSTPKAKIVCHVASFSLALWKVGIFVEDSKVPGLCCSLQSHYNLKLAHWNVPI